MRLTAQRRTRLVDLIVKHVPLSTLADVVQEQGIVSDFELALKSAPQEPEASKLYLAERVVDEYQAADAAQLLTKGLYRRAWRNDQFAAEMVPLIAEAAEGRAQEAAIAHRANTLKLRALREFLADNEPRICVVVAVSSFGGGQPTARKGTGFLVGPDLLLTAYHTLRDHILDCRQRIPSPGPLFAFFDHYEGAPIKYPLGGGIKARLVDFHEEWLIACCEDMPKDGEFRNASAEQEQQLLGRLDFALVRLADTVGLHTASTSGGARRGWIRRLGTNGPLRIDDRIIIPQHPGGEPQQIDFGRFTEADQSGTRIRYTTETEAGTSGAPCFSQDFSLVGMHNAAYMPEGITVANQAIRVERILEKLGPLITAADPPPATRVWNISANPNEPQVILGRDTLLDWIDRAAGQQGTSRATRVYAAIAPASPRCGKSFSVDILTAARRGSAEPIVVLGGAREQIPASVPDFIAAIAYQLRLPPEALETIPSRPSSDLPVGSADGDKLRKWASDEVPSWFDTILGRHRQEVVDRRLEARKAIDVLKAAGIAEAPKEYADLAAQPDFVPDTRNRWPVAWVVLDGLAEMRFSAEVRDLVSGLIGGKLAEPAVPAELRCLRWLFLGYAPDFLSPVDVTSETLDPMVIGASSIVAALRLHAATFDRVLDDDGGKIVQATFQTWMDGKDPDYGRAAMIDATRRLAALQTQFRALAPHLAALLRTQ